MIGKPLGLMFSTILFYSTVSGIMSSFSLKKMLTEIGINSDTLYRFKAIDSDSKKKTLTLKFAVRE